MTIFVSHVNAHQRITTAEEDFNKQVDRMACSVDTVSIFSPATPVITMGYEQSDFGGRNGGYA